MKPTETTYQMFMIAARECGFTEPSEISQNFILISLVAGEMVKESKERIITKLHSNPDWLPLLAAKYQQKIIRK